jgi:hypothetical protein
MNIWITALVAAVVSISVQAATDVAPPVKQISFSNSADTVKISDSIKGQLTAQYRLSAKAGQMLTVDLKPSNTSAYFNITAKGADFALFNSSVMGNHFLEPLPADGEYIVQVYLMRNAARRNEVANYRLSLHLSAADNTKGPPQPFDQKLELQGIVFHVTSEKINGGRVLRIAPQGLTIDNSDLLQPLTGDIVRAEVADLDQDGSPEIYVFVRSPARGLPGELIAYAANSKKSLSAIYLPSVSEDPKTAEGYQGEDEFAVGENALVQRFPIYDGADAEAGRTGKMRQVQYRLMPGEAGWVLKKYEVTEY